MKLSLFILLGLSVAVTARSLIRGSDPQMQLDLLHLLHRVYEPISQDHERIYNAAHNYNPREHLNDFNDDGEAVITLLNEIKNDRVLKRKHWFSLFNERHREEAIYLFKVLINAKDWTTFYSNAAYFREKVNEEQFVYALSVSITHCGMCYSLVLPPLYEIIPHMFANSYVMNEAYISQMKNEDNTLRMNFTGTPKNPEHRVAYFREDIGMNLHHVSWHFLNPFWRKDYSIGRNYRRGDTFFWVHHQLTVRYDAERLSNYLHPVEELQWNKPIHEGFAPHASYKYGGVFPTRADDQNFEDVEGVAKIFYLEAFENRIRDAIAHGYIIGKDGKIYDIRNEQGINLLGDLIEANEYSKNPQFYGSLHNLAHIVLGRQVDPKDKYDLPPSVMEHFETAMRDPAFFRLHKYMDNIFKEHKDSFPPYTKEEVYYPEVTIESVETDKPLVTKFEDFSFDLSQGVDRPPNSESRNIKAIVRRLTHEPFKFKFNLNNNKGSEISAIIRVFLCPKEDENGITYSFEEARWKCIELMRFVTFLKPGKNEVSRTSKYGAITNNDPFSYKELEQFAQAQKNEGRLIDYFLIDKSGCGIPNRFLLPKGKVSGMDFDLLVAATGDSSNYFSSFFFIGMDVICDTREGSYSDSNPHGYPFDRRVPDENVLLDLPNIYRKTVTITHIPDQ